MIYNCALSLKEKEIYLDYVFSITYRKFLHNILYNICRHTDQTRQHILPFRCTGSHQMENKQPLHKKWKMFLKTISKLSFNYYVVYVVNINILGVLVQYYFMNTQTFEIFILTSYISIIPASEGLFHKM